MVDKKFILVYGDPIDGLSFTGVFEHDEAVKYAEDNLRGITWNVAPLIDKEEE